MELVKNKTLNNITGSLLGYEFKLEFLSACLEAKSFTVGYDGQSAIFKLITCIQIERDNLPNNLITDVLYKLYSSHPAVDFIGEFIVNNMVYPQPLCKKL